MENRRGDRLPISLPVIIQNQQSSIGNFIVKNISAGGMSIHDPENRLSKGDIVYLKFGRNGRQPNIDTDYIKAIVIYRKKRTVGLMWAQNTTGLKTFVEDMSQRAAS